MKAVSSKDTQVSKDHSKRQVVYYAVQPMNRAQSLQDVSSSDQEWGSALYGPLTPRTSVSSAGSYFPMTQLLHSIFLKIAKYSNFRGDSGLDGGVDRNTSLPHTTKWRITTRIARKSNCVEV